MTQKISSYFIKTFGCQMNISDSERISSFLENKGFCLSENIESSDIVILNTCGVRQMAEDRVFGMVRNLKKNNPKIKIVVTGCLADRKDIHRRMKNVDLFFPVKNFAEFENWIIENCLEIGNWKLEIAEQKNSTTTSENINYLSISPKHSNCYAAYVPIMTGCDNFCSYCVVPYARGREVSRPAEEIISEIKELVAKGYKSITLLGQNVNSYKSKVPKAGKSIEPADEINFSKLLKMIDKLPGKFWIYFVSSHPKDMDDEAIETITGLKKVCENIHLPIQAGDDEILRKMNRKYTKKYYLGLVRKIKKAFQKNKPLLPFSISSDIIVGFPGETKKQFEKSAEVMTKSKFDMVFFGQYSPRPGTTAFKMKDNVSNQEKERREQYLNEILKKTALANNKKYVGQKIEVLVEKEKNGPVKSGSPDHGVKFYFGKTRTLKNVKILTNRKKLVGKFVKLEITRANTWNLEGYLH